MYLGAMYASVAMVSANYWRKCCNGSRRNADLLLAKVSFLVTVVTGARHVRDPTLLAVGWPLAAAIPALFALAIHLHDRPSVFWIPAHMAMHAAITAGMSLVVVGSGR